MKKLIDIAPKIILALVVLCASLLPLFIFGFGIINAIINNTEFAILAAIFLGALFLALLLVQKFIEHPKTKAASKFIITILAIAFLCILATNKQ